MINSVLLHVFEGVVTRIEALCQKAEQLQNDRTTNLAESYMSVVEKFIGGKANKAYLNQAHIKQ